MYAKIKKPKKVGKTGKIETKKVIKSKKGNAKNINSIDLRESDEKTHIVDPALEILEKITKKQKPINVHKHEYIPELERDEEFDLVA